MKLKFKRIVVAVAALFVLASCALKKPVPEGSQLDRPVRASYIKGTTAFDGTVQVVAYNVERGFFWEDALAYIKERRAEVPATIVLLSECDRNHSRTNDVFVADELARALSMDMVFVTEYIEYNDETDDAQGDHGNAILSPFPMSDITVIRHTTIFSWTDWGWMFGQPRRGERVTIGATIELPGGKKVRVYTTHLESNAGQMGKWKQMSETIKDAELTDLPVVIGGDFNEFPNGLMFKKFPDYKIENPFADDKSATGSCKPGDGQAECKFKIDWIVYRGLDLIDRSVDYPLNSEGGIISDHAPVRATFGVE